MITKMKILTAVLSVAGFGFAGGQAFSQGYYGGNACCPPATFSGDCCQPSLPAVRYAPPQYAPATAVSQQYIAPQGYAPPPTPQVVPQYGIGTSQFSYRPLLPIAQQPAVVQVGRGILGQPTVYVPGQPVRNLLRYISPF